MARTDVESFAEGGPAPRPPTPGQESNAMRNETEKLSLSLPTNDGREDATAHPTTIRLKRGVFGGAIAYITVPLAEEGPRWWTHTVTVANGVVRNGWLTCLEAWPFHQWDIIGDVEAVEPEESNGWADMYSQEAECVVCGTTTHGTHFGSGATFEPDDDAPVGPCHPREVY